MSFRQNLVKARGHLVFIAALAFGLVLVSYLDQVAGSRTQEDTVPVQTAMDTFDAIVPMPLSARWPSSPEDIAFAKIAWKYFQNNTNAVTGLVNSADKYPSTTMWETGSYFIAVVSANLLGLIDDAEAKARIELALTSLSTLRLYDGLLPNKAYNVETVELVDYSNKPAEKGLGWSALDIGRFTSTLGVVENHFPELSPHISAVLSHWSLDHMVRDGQLIGGNVIEGVTREDQEGRVGYEQYAAKAMMLFGFDMYRSYRVEDNLMIKEVEGQPIPVDTRLHRGQFSAFTVSEPYIFDGLEFGFDSRSVRFATSIYKAQEARFKNSGVLTAVSESHVDVAPYFVYSTVWGAGEPWAVLSFKGERFDSLRTVSTKVSFAWDALFGTDYTRELMKTIGPLGDPEKGFPEGVYEVGGKTNGSTTANTNAVVLAALAFRAFGPLLHAGE